MFGLCLEADISIKVNGGTSYGKQLKFNFMDLMDSRGLDAII